MIELATGLLLFGVINVFYSHKLLTRVLLLLACSTITGIFSRLALYISGSSAPLDFIKFSIEVSIIVCALQLFKRRPIPGNRMVIIMDWLMAATFLFFTLCAFNLIFVGPGITIGGWRWTCIPMLMYFVARRIKRPEQITNYFFHF